VITVVGVTVLIMMATNRSDCRLASAFAGVRPELARPRALLLLCAAVGVMGVIRIGLTGCPSAATQLMGGVLIFYTIVGGAYRQWLSRVAMLEGTPAVTTYTIQLGNGALRADLWVNGVHLGKTPVQMTLDALCAKVPAWEKAPKGFRDGTDEVRATRYSLEGREESVKQRWFRFGSPAGMEFCGRHSTCRRHRCGYSYLYARVRLDGEWGCDEPGGWRDLVSLGADLKHYCTMLSVTFPGRQSRLEGLLDKCRLEAYGASPEWFRALETYGEQGETALRRAAGKWTRRDGTAAEPEFGAVLDAWAVRRYGLNEVTDAESAWSAFVRVCTEAEARGEYYPASVAGRAVTLLAPRLDAEQFVNRALGWIRRRRSRPRLHGTIDGEIPVVVTKGRWRMTMSVAPQAEAAAHAARMLDQALDQRGAPRPNPVERRFAPGLIRWRPSVATLRTVTAIGGPDVAQFLVRQYKRGASARDYTGQYEEHLDLDLDGALSTPSSWLCFLATLQDPEGDQFRMEHEWKLMDLADRWGSSQLICHDLHRGPRSLAAKYWPRFKAKTVGRRHEALQAQWKYLVRMDPASTVEMYLEAWREFPYGDRYRMDALRELEALPLPKRRAVSAALIADVQRWDETRATSKAQLLQRLEHATADEHTAHQVMAELHAGAPEDRRKHVALWLEHTRPDHPLVRLLAAADEPALRLLVMGALKAHPTPKNLEVLNELLKGSDAMVRAAAEKVRAGLAALVAEGPMAFRAGVAP